MKITRKGRHKLFGPDGKLISEHTDTDEAYEKADAHAQTLPAGVHTYRIVPAEKEYEVSTLSRIVYDTDTTRPSAPVLGSVAALSTSSLRITWTGSTDTGGSGLSGYRVKRSSSSGGTYAQVGSDLSTASLSFDDTGLTASTTYYYRVFSFDGAGNESLASNTGFGTTLAETSTGYSAQGVTGDLVTDGTIVIAALSGESFGSSGPNIILYEDGRNGSSGASLSNSDPEIGSWSSNGGPRWDGSQSVSRGRSLQVKRASVSREDNAVVTFSDSTEIFYSFYLRCTIDSDEILGGQCKVTWLMDTNSGDADPSPGTLYDVCLPTKSGNSATGWQLAGNWPISSTYGFSVGQVLTANEWARVSIWMKGHTSPHIAYQRISASLGHQSLSQDKTLTQFWRTAAQRFNTLKFGSFINQSGHDIWMDQIYVALPSGSTGAAARVEIGENQTYSSCRNLQLLTVSSWSSSSITARVDPDFTLPGKYIHIHDSTNTHTNGGTGRLIS